MKKLLLTSVAALFLATGAAHATSDPDDVKWFFSGRNCHIRQPLEARQEGWDSVAIGLDELLEMQKFIPMLKKCEKFYKCLEKRDAGKVKHCYLPKGMTTES
jgi:hypothetical protein